MNLDGSRNNFRAAILTALAIAALVWMVVSNRQLAQPAPKVELGPGLTGQALDQKPQPSPEVGSKPTASQEVALPSYQDGTITLAGQVLNIALADDLSEQLAGLENRPSMGENEGMLFVLAKTYIPEFWMKDMLFGLDIVWIRDALVVDISPNLGIEPGKTDNDLKRYLPKEEVDMVLELNAGWAAKHGLLVGGEVKVNLLR